MLDDPPDTSARIAFWTSRNKVQPGGRRHIINGNKGRGGQRRIYFTVIPDIPDRANEPAVAIRSYVSGQVFHTACQNDGVDPGRKNSPGAPSATG
jgi:hypothetical protein